MDKPLLKDTDILPPDETGQILIYQNEQGDTKIDVFFAGDTIWMKQAGVAKLYQVTPQNITQHIKNIYEDGELPENATCKELLQVQTEGSRQVSRGIKHYNFQMILAIGYRVRSSVGIHFRSWATSVLTEYSKKGFAMNDERLKNPLPFGADYFEELLERIRDIRTSEKRFYQKICDIYATSIDYEPGANNTNLFFSTVQNKMHYSVHGNTAAEIIASRADAYKPNMGLITFKGAKVRKEDVFVAKNYLSEPEISELNRIVSMYLDFAEDQARRHIPMHMANWEERLADFLQFNGREVLQNSGTISAKLAQAKAEQEYVHYNERRQLAETDINSLEIEIKNISHGKK